MHTPSAPSRNLESPDLVRWTAVVARDAAFDGNFFYSVRTTGVYCRPSCAARRPNRANVGFYDTAAEAERAGFRPCKRCKPTGPSLAEGHAEKVMVACRILDSAEEAPTLGELADAVGMSPYHFHRIFKAAVGVTPKAYAGARRNKPAPDAPRRSGTEGGPAPTSRAKS
jgi:AraC family transcriptional regulator, regulatory protein of adaptative response / methylated-DNA-[protein]-cysteine methyltransferase